MNEKPGFLKRSTQDRGKELYLKLFVAAFACMMLSFIPSMIFNKGIFLYYGDFNSQQMMFYQHANEVVKDVGIGWDWGTDLGSNFIGSYSFYLLGSPFFWLSTLFPLSAVAYLMPWLLALKTAVAAVAAYAFIRRFVGNKSACFIGAMLYAFSGFQTYNVFFNHFHDATAFFPLLLLAFELLTQENKKGAFAIMVAVCAAISYFFFVCEVVFIVIYFFIRMTDKSFKMNMKIFGVLVFESILGFVISFAILLPSVMDVIANPRVNSYLWGLDIVAYSDNLRLGRIFQAFFMLSDMPARVNILSSDKARWASLAGYLPMFSMCGVIAFMRTRKKTWQGRMIIVCMIMACVPFLNAAFVLFNSSYYARWFYMPILIMCLMTAQVIDKDKNDLRYGFVPTALIGAIFVGIGLLPKKVDGEVVYGKVPKYTELYYVQAIVTIAMIIMLFFAVYKVAVNKHKRHVTLCIMTSVACAVCMMSSVIYGVVQGDDNPDYIERAINGRDNIDLSVYDGDQTGVENTFYRIDTSENVDNWCMYWGLSSMRTFHSVVPTSIMDFYTSIGQTRDVASRMEPKLYALRGLFSVKYYFKEWSDKALEGKEEPEENPSVSELSDFEYVGTQNKFYIFENKNYVPMGFAYNTYVTDEDMKKLGEVEKPVMLMESLVLSDEQVQKYGSVITKFDKSKMNVSRPLYNKAVKEKQEMSCYSFRYDSQGFEAKIKLDTPKLVFFSVPYEKGWSAEVNGTKADIEKVSYGFMAVLVPAGDSTIKFSFKAEGLTLGRIATAGGIAVLVIYWVVDYDRRKKRGEEVSIPVISRFLSRKSAPKD